MDLLKQQIVKEIEKLGPWWHTINLGNGIKTHSGSKIDPDHPQRLWNTIKNYLPLDLSGRSVMDVGCNAGFFCIEAKRRWAKRVVGIDINSGCIRQAKFISGVLGLDIEYNQKSIYELAETDGMFDIAFCFSLLYHLNDLTLGLERILRLVKNMIIIETAIMSYPSEPPIIKIFDSGFYRGQTIRSLPNISAITSILKKNNFKIIEIRPFKAGIFREFMRFLRAIKTRPLSYLIQRKCADSRISRVIANRVFKDYIPIKRMIFVARRL